MAPWSLDKLQEYRKDVFEKLETDLVEFLYNRVGGIPRYVMQVAEECLVQGLDREEIENVAYGHVREALMRYKTCGKLLQ